MHGNRFLVVIVLALCLARYTSAFDAESLEPTIIDYLWGEQSVSDAAIARIEDDPELRALSRTDFETLQAVLRRVRPEFEYPKPDQDPSEPDRFEVKLPGGGVLPTQVTLPPDYDPGRPWPVILAMHGGPNRHHTLAVSGAMRMTDIWREPAADAGWILVTPAMVHVVARAERTVGRLPYDIMTAEQMEALLERVARRYNIDPDRVISTGVSLGANFSVAYAAARPDRFAGILPVSMEGDSREHLIRNLHLVPTYVLAGTEDRNVRDIDGPRKFAAIQDRLGHDSVYVEFPNRGHEAFEQHYPEALEWLAARPRDPYPREVSRTPHSGIVPVSRRVHWLEVDARQGLAHARIEDAQRIEVTARWTRYITVYLHDRLVDLDRPVEIRINGKSMFSSRVQRSLPVALRQLRDLRDPARIYAAVVTLQVPQSEVSLAAARRLSDSIEPTIEEGRLSYWEFYATRALEERFPELGLSGEELSEVPGIALDGERVAIRITEVAPDGAFSGTGLSAGDLLLEVGGEPLFAGKGLDSLHHWLLRELVANERIYALVAWRDGAELRLQVPFALGPFRGPTFN